MRGAAGGAGLVLVVLVRQNRAYLTRSIAWTAKEIVDVSRYCTFYSLNSRTYYFGWPGFQDKCFIKFTEVR